MAARGEVTWHYLSPKSTTTACGKQAMSINATLVAHNTNCRKCQRALKAEQKKKEEKNARSHSHQEGGKRGADPLP